MDLKTVENYNTAIFELAKKELKTQGIRSTTFGILHHDLISEISVAVNLGMAIGEGKEQLYFEPIIYSFLHTFASAHLKNSSAVLISIGLKDEKFDSNKVFVDSADRIDKYLKKDYSLDLTECFENIMELVNTQAKRSKHLPKPETMELFNLEAVTTICVPPSINRFRVPQLVFYIKVSFGNKYKVDAPVGINPPKEVFRKTLSWANP